MTEPYIGQIAMFSFNFAPRLWAQCDGQLMQISQNTSLYNLLGTTFGGDGNSTFGIPDLRGRVPVHPGQSAEGAVEVSQGAKGGAEAVTLYANTMPTHTHDLQASTLDATERSPQGRVLAQTDQAAYARAKSTGLAAMSKSAVAAAGYGQAHPNVQPSLVVSFCIALEGLYPSRNSIS